ncbi:hypothetical protein D3C81_2160390 [compost metagenome]
MNEAQADLFLDTVNYTVLDQRLDKQPGNLQAEHIVVDFYLIADALLSQILDRQIILQQLQLFKERRE